jgi:hypothetical protein
MPVCAYQNHQTTIIAAAKIAEAESAVTNSAVGFLDSSIMLMFFAVGDCKLIMKIALRVNRRIRL